MDAQQWKDSRRRRLARMLARRFVRPISWRLSRQLTRAMLLPRTAPDAGG
jgi:hypothetical protein